MKICTLCKILKKETEFSPRKTALDGLSSRCKICHNTEVRKAYRLNPDIKLEYHRKKRQELVDIVNEIKEKSGCCNCSEKNSVCLDFHHIDPTKKDLTVSKLMFCKSKDRMLKEIKKCVVLCANCHRKFHAGIIKLPIDVMVA